MECVDEGMDALTGDVINKVKLVNAFSFSPTAVKQFFVLFFLFVV